jgi:predicted HD phosphohydrolase
MSIPGTMRMPFFSFSKKQLYTRDNLTPRVHRPVSEAERIADEIIYLYKTNGAKHLDGERVSHVSHMVQCAMLAMKSLNGLPVIIGALLHDIGHLIKHEQPADDVGKSDVTNYGGISGAYLRAKGFSERVCAMAEQQVAAKRYLVATDESYKITLSSASLYELERHGGPMLTNEVQAFEKHLYFIDIVNLCRWDEAAKNPNATLLPVTWFWKLLWDHLYCRIS